MKKSLIFQIDMIQLGANIASPDDASNIIWALATFPCIGGARVMVEPESTTSASFTKKPKHQRSEVTREKDRIRSAKRRAMYPDKVRQEFQAWYIRNRPKVAAQSRQWYAAHPDEMTVKREKDRQHAKAHPELGKARGARRRARQAAVAINDLTAAQWEEIKTVYGHRCVYCGRKMQRLEQDHIMAIANGGNHTASNVVPACRTCNARKGTKSPLIPVQPLLLTVAKPHHMGALEAGKKQAAEDLAATTIPDMTYAEARRLAGDELADAIYRGEVTLITGEVRH
jgi:5-methylcytosine-specific restriction endonuclease McrA